jgi:hypothetical protein
MFRPLTRPSWAQPERKTNMNVKEFAISVAAVVAGLWAAKRFNLV